MWTLFLEKGWTKLLSGRRQGSNFLFLQLHFFTREIALTSKSISIACIFVFPNQLFFDLMLVQNMSYLKWPYSFGCWDPSVSVKVAAGVCVLEVWPPVADCDVSPQPPGGRNSTTPAAQNKSQQQQRQDANLASEGFGSLFLDAAHVRGWATNSLEMWLFWTGN